MPITAQTQTFFRKDEFGRFARKLEGQGNDMLEDMVSDGRRFARAIAPRGTHRGPPRPGHVHFKDSIVPVSYSGGQEQGWGTTAKHFWWYVRGTSPHKIVGRLVFFWDDAGSWFVWNHPKFGPVGSGKGYENWTEQGGAWVNHPGTRPHANWLLRSYRMVADRAPSYMRRHYG